VDCRPLLLLKDNGEKARNEQSLFSFSSVVADATATAASPMSRQTDAASAFAASFRPLDVPSLSFIRQAEEAMNAYMALYAYVCALCIEWDVDGGLHAGELLFLPFSPKRQVVAGSPSSEDESSGGDGEHVSRRTKEGDATPEHRRRKEGMSSSSSSSPPTLTPGQFAAVDALFSSSLSCSCSYAPPPLVSGATAAKNTPAVYIPLLPKYMMFLQHVLQSPRLVQVLRSVSPRCVSVGNEEGELSSSVSASSSFTVSVTDGVFLEAACVMLFSILDVVDYFPVDGDAGEENTRKEEGKRVATRKGEDMLSLLESASGGISLVGLLQRLFLLYTAVRQPQEHLVSRLFTCVERCYGALSTKERSRWRRGERKEDTGPNASPELLFPALHPGLSFSFLAAKALLTPSLLQGLGESSGSAALAVLHAHLYGILAAQEERKKDEREEAHNADGGASLVRFPPSTPASPLPMAHLLGCLTYLPPGQLSHHSAALNFYLTILRYVCRTESIFSAADAEGEEAKAALLRADGQGEEGPEPSHDSSSLFSLAGVKETESSPPTASSERGLDALLSRQRSPPPSPSFPRQRRWWWWRVEKNASPLLCTYPTLLSSLMEAASALQGRVAAGYLYGVEGPFQGALERTWRLIAILTTTARAHSLLVNTVIPVLAYPSWTAGPFSS